MVSIAFLLTGSRGSVVAPAGTGKTDLISRAAKENSSGTILILTHTHAGVRAIKDRLRKYGVPKGNARVETITGWCLRYALAYPGAAGLSTRHPVGSDWEAVSKGAIALLSLKAIRSVLQATYSRVFVDEYQDCTRTHHALIAAIAEVLPTFVLGDPLQGIFSFAGGTLSWSREVEAIFPPLGTLSEPWRWHQKNDALGQWLLDIREPLINGSTIDLLSGPLKWNENTIDNQREAAYSLVNESGSIVAIRKWAAEAHEYARNIGGLFQSMEEVECKDLMSFCLDMDKLVGTSRAARLVAFAQSCMTEVGSDLDAVFNVLSDGRVPDPSRYKFQEVVRTLVEVCTHTDPAVIRLAMSQIENIPGSKIFRRELWQEAARSVHALERGFHDSLFKAGWSQRDRLRVSGRAPDLRSVSRTLLIKGLEFDHALVVNAQEFYDQKRPEDAARHFYVAITRGSRSLTVLSSSPEIRFAPCPV